MQFNGLQFCQKKPFPSLFRNHKNEMFANKKRAWVTGRCELEKAVNGNIFRWEIEFALIVVNHQTNFRLFDEFANNENPDSFVLRSHSPQNDSIANPQSNGKCKFSKAAVFMEWVYCFALWKSAFLSFAGVDKWRLACISFALSLSTAVKRSKKVCKAIKNFMAL